MNLLISRTICILLFSAISANLDGSVNDKWTYPQYASYDQIANNECAYRLLPHTDTYQPICEGVHICCNWENHIYNSISPAYYGTPSPPHAQVFALHFSSDFNTSIVYSILEWQLLANSMTHNIGIHTHIVICM